MLFINIGLFLHQQTVSSFQLFIQLGRKVRTPKGCIPVNSRRHALGVNGQVQQKVCTGNAVVKSGKLYAVKCHVNL